MLGQLRSRHLFETLWEAAADAMVLSDAEGTILAANPAYYQLVGATPEDVLGQSFAALLPESRRLWATDGYRRLFTEVEARPGVEAVLAHKDGSERTVEVRYAFLLQGDQRAAMLSIVRDITQRKQLEARLHELVSFASHDLKLPLTAIKGYSQLLQRRLQQEGPREVGPMLEELAAIGEAADQIERLITELLEAASHQEPRVPSLTREPMDLVALVQHQADTWQRTDDGHTLRVQSTVPQLVGQWDGRQLERAIGNILANAVKYSPKDSVITVRIAATLTGGGRWAVLSVQDAGSGIPAADLPHIFEPFYRGDNVAAVAGSGLGLAGARQSIEQHGGTIDVSSVEGEGTTVTVRLPLDTRPG